MSDLVHAARGLAPGEQAALLEQECSHDLALRAEVESLLRVAMDVGSFLNRPAIGSEAAGELAEIAKLAPTPLPTGLHFSSMQILKSLGSGGMGDVYLALQDHPRRRVALKIIRVGLDTDDAIARFRLEQQAMAAMAHPNIAQIFEVGVTPTEAGARPYFTMEYVDGEPITEYCDRCKRTIRQRLELFVAVCDGVQHAHNRGIVHRDLKPTNVLVTEVEGRPVPKVIDFGIAKDIDGTGGTRTVYAPGGGLVGTPEYMSPEQASASADVDTRTDVYSLGVMLYELLAGRLPFPSAILRAHGLDEARRIVRDDKPPRPSSAVGALGDAADGIASCRGHEADSLARELRRELEWIPLAAMRKERDRRYQTPRDLAEDLRRYLDRRALWAAPESRAYIARKFAGRHWRVIAAAVAMTAAVAAAMWGLGRASVERAERLRDRVRAEYDQYAADIAGAQVALNANDVVTARELLNHAPTDKRGWEWSHLQAALSNSLAVQHADPDTAVHSIALSRDGARAAIGLSNGVVLVWNWMQDTDPRRCVGHANGVTQVDFSADGTRLLSASLDGTMLIWDLAHEPAAARKLELAGGFDNAVFSPDGTRVITTYIDGSGQEFDASSGHPLAGGHRHGTSAGTRHTYVSSNGLLAATLNLDDSVEVWRWADGHPLFSMDGRGKGGAAGLAIFSPAGDRVAQAWDNHIRMRSTAAGDSATSMDGHNDVVCSLAFSPDGTQLASASMDGTARLWTTRDRQCRFVLRGHDAPVSKVLFTPDGEFILTAAHDATIRLWSVSTGEALAVLHGHEAPLVHLAVSDDGKWALSSGLDGSIRVWDVERSVAAAALSHQPGNATAAAFSPDGSRIVIPTGAGSVTTGSAAIWNLQGGRKLLNLTGHTKEVWSAAFNRDGTRVVTASNDGTACVWDAEAERPPLLVLHHEDWVNWAAFSPDGTRVVTASGDGTARVWDAATGREQTRFEHSAEVRCAVFSPDGTGIATACDDGAVRIWDLTSKRVIRTLAGHKAPVICVSYSSSGKLLASCAENGTAKVWNAATGSISAELLGHAKPVLSVSFSPDDSRIVTACWDKSVRVWDTDTGHVAAVFREHHRGVNWSVFSRDGTCLLSTDQDGALLVRDCGPRRRDRQPGLEQR